MTYRKEDDESESVHRIKKKNNKIKICNVIVF